MTTKAEYRAALKAWKHALTRQGRRAHDEALDAAERTLDPGVIALARQACGLDDDPSGMAVHALIAMLEKLTVGDDPHDRMTRQDDE